MIILASTSSTRAAMLSAAGVAFTAVAPRVDEDAAKAALRAQGLGPRDLADALAELKAMRVASGRPDDLVIGCDQTLALSDGTMLDKPGNDLAAQLRMLSGRSHRLYSAAVAVERGAAIWRSVETVTLTVRPLSEAFIAQYTAEEGPVVAECLGGYRVEGRGVQIFSSIEGSHFAVLGLPLLPLLSWLRARGLMTS